MEKHFVKFYSAGSFVAEETVKEIDSWDVNKAIEMSKDITERYGAKPYGFRFITKGRTDADLDSTGVLMCPMHDMCKYIEELLGRPVFTHELADPQVVAEIKAKAKPDFLALCSGNK